MYNAQAHLYRNEEPLKQLAKRLTQVEIIQEVNRIPYARLFLVDGDVAQRGFSLSNEANLEPGEPVDIWLDYGDEDSLVSKPPVFRGMIVKQTIENLPTGGFQLVAELYSKAVAMTQRRRSRTFYESSDAQIFREIIQEHGLTVGTIAETEPVHREMVQYQCSDWDFLRSRVEFNGLWIIIRPGEGGQEIMDVLEPSIEEGSTQYQFSFGSGATPIYNFEMETGLFDQFGTVTGQAWDSAEQEMSRPLGSRDFALKQGNLHAAQLAEKVDSSEAMLITSAAYDESELQSWSDARLRRSRLAMLRGRIQTRGDSRYQLNDCFGLENFSDRFDGKTLLTGIRHELSLSGWQADLQFGLAPGNAMERQSPEKPLASGALPAIQGLHIGTVVGYEKDESRQLLAQVNVPEIHPTDGLVWARLSTPYGGQDHGFFFRPEIGDEVILAFIDNDPRHAFILGAAYSDANFPAVSDESLEPENHYKSLVSRQGHEIAFNDEKGELTITARPAPGEEGHFIRLGHKDESAIEIKDVHGNQIVLNAEGITIKSDKKILIEGQSIDLN